MIKFIIILVLIFHSCASFSQESAQSKADKLIMRQLVSCNAFFSIMRYANQAGVLLKSNSIIIDASTINFLEKNEKYLVDQGKNFGLGKTGLSRMYYALDDYYNVNSSGAFDIDIAGRTDELEVKKKWENGLMGMEIEELLICSFIASNSIDVNIDKNGAIDAYKKGVTDYIDKQKSSNETRKALEIVSYFATLTWQHFNYKLNSDWSENMKKLVNEKMKVK